MPTISKIRMTNVVYAQGQKRYHDEIFLFDGLNGAIVLENGGGKSVFIQTVLQAVIPHTDVGERKVKDTLVLDEGPAHIAIEWLLNERPRRYAVTAVTLYKKINGIDSLRYVYEYGEHDPHSIEHIPFVQGEGKEKRSSSRGEIADYYSYMTNRYRNAKTFAQSIKAFREYIEQEFQIIASEWDSIVLINSEEGGVEKFFENCKKTNELIDRLLIPSVETGIAGFKKEIFADIFENRREQFKKYKELKETIAQNKLLSQELEVYVDRFREVDQQEKLYVTSRRKAKGYQIHLMGELEQIATKLGQLEAAFDDWREQERRLAMKKDSLAIHREEEHLTELAAKEKEIQTRLAEVNEQLQLVQHEYYSLQFARAREEIRKEQENIALFERELDNLERNLEVEELIEELTKINGQIHYLFLKKKAEIKQQKQQTEETLQQLYNQQTDWQGRQKQLQQQLKDWQERSTQTKVEAELAWKRMNTLKSELLSHEHEAVEDLLQLGTQKLSKLDEEKVATVEHLNELEPSIKGYKDKNSQLLKQLQENSLKLSKLEEQRRSFDVQHDKMLKLLAETMPQWTYLDSVYNRHTSIQHQIEEHLTKLKRKKEKLLEEERQAKRFVDDYLDQDQFFAEPYVEKQIQQWNQFEYLITGVQYLQSVRNDIYVEPSHYPFWALTLITTDREKQAVVEKVKSIQHHLKYPIFVISANEAKQLIQGEQVYEEVVEPAIWQMNQDRKRFAEWKEQIAQEAERITVERKDAEEAIQTWANAKEQLQQFLHDYPHEKYVEITGEIQASAHELQNVREEQKRVAETIEELEREFQRKKNYLHSLEIEIQDLQNRLIPKAMEYISIKKEYAQLLQQRAEYERQTKELAEQEVELLHKLERIAKELLQKRDELRDLENVLIYEIDRDDLFQAVQGYDLIPTDAPMETLKIKHRRLNDQINQIQTTRREWESRIESSKRRIEDLTGDQHRLKNEYDRLDEDYPFPVNGAEKIEQLTWQRKELSSEVEHVSKRHQQAMTNKQVQEIRVNEKIQQYQENYPNQEVIPFVDELALVERELAEEHQALHKRLDYLHQQQKWLEKEQDNCNLAQKKFERYELVHKLEDPKLEGIVLSEEEQLEFSYKREEIVDQLIGELERKQAAVTNQLTVLERSKDNFKKFCQQLSDPKLRKNAIEGVDTKKTYDEVLRYQQQLEERIARTIQIAEVTIQDYDKEQQQFITYIHTHLQKVREDLIDIEKKTRVRVGDEWKTIYQIQVPDWDEEEAKEKIREHIDWILSQIEREHYRDEYGEEDATKIRHFLEKTLQTVPLLREVIGNQTIKVRCRKVESDQHISNNYYTWEQSNQWSGGEKWSKNMALFLGLLNFIAEKSHAPQSNAQRHRTVILDNPFGQASSDHVLSPVFFIADQLGFQMIALTAHAEGKFLSDYFPIIYSCKLRYLQGGTKQVLTKEKQIKVAYFQDHVPERLERLGEQQQLALFE